MTEIPPAVLDRIRNEAEEAYPEECCGFLAGIREEAAGAEGGAEVTVRVLDALPARNVAAREDRRRRFRIDPKVLLEVMKAFRDRTEDVVGFYHSHPDHPARLSPTDLEFARLWPRTVWLIVPVHPVPGRREAKAAAEGGETAKAGIAEAGAEAGDTARAGIAGQERAWWLPARPAGAAERQDEQSPIELESIERDSFERVSIERDTEILESTIEEMTIRSPGTRYAGTPHGGDHEAGTSDRGAPGRIPTPRGDTA